MATPAIQVEGVWKDYVVGAAEQRHTTLYDALTTSIAAPWRRLRRLGAGGGSAERFWALRDVNFEVAHGEVLGIIGRNGAGKSTLLKVLSRVTAPTRGRIAYRGRLTSLLEVGTGFHPELSGRENVFLNATILGMSRAEILRKFDEIVAFSGVERFLDTPVKRYSSGMYVRLAFAVAAHIEADILLIDEVLAVGDAEFQQRCLGKMKDVARTGRTVLFVSHNTFAMRSLCSRGVLLDQGTVALAGPIAQVLNAYAGGGDSLGASERRLDPPSSAVQAYVSRVCTRPLSGPPGEPLSATLGVCVEVDLCVNEPCRVEPFLHCYNDEQVMVFSSSSFFGQPYLEDVLGQGTHRFTCELPGFFLNDGEYALDVHLVRNRQDVIAAESSVLTFRIIDDFPSTPGWRWRPLGVVRPRLVWRHHAPGGPLRFEAVAPNNTAEGA